MNRQGLAWLLLVVVIGSGVVQAAGPGSFELGVRVQDEEGRPGASLQVFLTNQSDTKDVRLGQTAANGQATITGLNGTYWLEVVNGTKAAGELWANRTHVVSQAGSLTVHRTFPYVAVVRFYLTDDPDAPVGEALRGEGVSVEVEIGRRETKEALQVDVAASLRFRDEAGTDRDQAVTLDTTQKGVYGLKPNGTGTLRADVAVDPKEPYNERAEEVRLSITVASKAGRPYDHHEAMLRFTSSCSEADREFFTFQELGWLGRMVCVPRVDKDAWTAWVDAAQDFVAAENDARAAMARAIAAGASLDVVLAAWEDYGKATRDDGDLLDELEALSAVASSFTQADLDAIEHRLTDGSILAGALFAKALGTRYNATSEDIEAARSDVGRSVLVWSAAGFLVGTSAAIVSMVVWKRRAEYWRGFSSRAASNPMVIAVSAAGALLLVTLVWLLVAGPAFFSGIAP